MVWFICLQRLYTKLLMKICLFHVCVWSRWVLIIVNVRLSYSKRHWAVWLIARILFFGFLFALFLFFGVHKNPVSSTILAPFYDATNLIVRRCRGEETSHKLMIIILCNKTMLIIMSCFVVVMLNLSILLLTWLYLSCIVYNVVSRISFSFLFSCFLLYTISDLVYTINFYEKVRCAIFSRKLQIMYNLNWKIIIVVSSQLLR